MGVVIEGLLVSLLYELSRAEWQCNGALDRGIQWVCINSGHVGMGLGGGAHGCGLLEFIL